MTAVLAPTKTRLETIGELRGFARQLVRELGYMRSPMAGSELSPSAVHAIIEIGARPGLQARDLATLLRLDKSNTSRQLTRLEAMAAIRREAVDGDARSFALYLTETGQQLYRQVEAFGTQQVAKVLEQLDEEDQSALGRYVSLFATALSRDNPHIAPTVPRPERVVSGYRAGCLGEIASLYTKDYAGTYPTLADLDMEEQITRSLGRFLRTLPEPGNALWLYVEDGRVLGSIALAGDLSTRQAQLKWFIVDPLVRNTGVGRQLLDAALEQADRQFDQVDTCTFSTKPATQAGLRALYESHGLLWQSEAPTERWGLKLVEQRYSRQARNTA